MTKNGWMGTERNELPTVHAMAPPTQWVGSPGGSKQQLDALPVTGRLVLLPPKQDAEDSAA